MSKWWRFRKDSAYFGDNEYSNYADGTFSIIGPERGNSVGLEEEDEEDQGFVEKLPEEEDLCDWSLELEPAKTPGLKPDFVNDHTQLEPSDADEDLIDRQFEAECPELCASHSQVTDYDDLRNDSTWSSDCWEVEEREKSPCTRKSFSLDQFTNELFNIAEDSSPAPPQMARVGDWEGSPWRSSTPFRPVCASRTGATTQEKKVAIIDLSQDTEDEGCNGAAVANGQTVKESDAVKDALKHKPTVNVYADVNTTKKGKMRVERRAGHAEKKQLDDCAAIVDSLDHRICR